MQMLRQAPLPKLEKNHSYNLIDQPQYTLHRSLIHPSINLLMLSLRITLFCFSSRRTR